jgi:hypothetical protein
MVKANLMILIFKKNFQTFFLAFPPPSPLLAGLALAAALLVAVLVFFCTYQ